MDYKFLLQRFIKILFSPAKAWKSINSDDKLLKEVRNSYLFPMLLILFLASLAGSWFIAKEQLSFVHSLLSSVNYVILILIVTWLSAVVLREITYALDLGRDYQVAWRLIVYSLTPLYLCLIVSNLFESLFFVNILALYSLFVFWDGMIVMLNPPDHKKIFLLVSTFITIAGIYAAVSIILNLILERFYNAFFA
jgi:hypothetical protein